MSSESKSKGSRDFLPVQRVANSSSSEKQNNDEFLFLVPRYELSLSARDFFTVASLFYLLAQILCFPDFSLFNLRCNLRR